MSFGSHTQPPILLGDHFYSHYTVNERNDGLVAMSMDGQVKWKTDQDPAFVRGGMVLADGKLLVRGQKELKVLQVRIAAASLAGLAAAPARQRLLYIAQPGIRNYQQAARRRESAHVSVSNETKPRAISHHRLIEWTPAGQARSFGSAHCTQGSPRRSGRQNYVREGHRR